MLYKTIVLELLQQQTEWHERLRVKRKLLQTLEKYALELQARHEAWQKDLSQRRPGSAASQIASEAMELALQELQDSLASASRLEQEQPLSLDQPMDSPREHNSED